MPRGIRAEKGNLVIGNYKLVETITLTITISNCHYSRIRMALPNSEKQLLFMMTHKKYKLVHKTKSKFFSNMKYCFQKLLIGKFFLMLQIFGAKIKK